MRKQSRSFLLLSTFGLVGALAVVGAQEGRAQTAQPSLWSDPATWPNHKVPVAGDKPTIGRDKEVILDVSPPALGGLSIDGKLTFANDADLELTTEWIMLHGELAIGSEASPHTHKATITLTNTVKGEDVMAGMGDRGIMISGGTLNLHGDRTNTWTKLASTAKAGSTSIEVLNAAGWRVGDEIVLASTDYDPRQAERRTISAISGNKITLDKKLDYMHFGKITFDVDERGEVGLLTRNIKIQASADAEQSFFGGHIMAMPSSHMYVEGVELNRMGQNLTLARYPIHWHLVGDAKGQYIKNAAIHDTYSRCVTVHGTNYLQVENNVTYNTVGHCFFLEDGIEHGNQFVHNLAIQTKCHTSKPCDPTNLAPFGSSSDGLNFKTDGPGLQGSPDPFGQHGVDVTGSPTRTTSSATTWPRVPTRQVSGSPSRSIPRASSKARRSARPRGQVARSSASSRATSPIRTSTASWATARPGPMAISPSAGMFPLSIPLTRTALKRSR